MKCCRYLDNVLVQVGNLAKIDVQAGIDPVLTRPHGFSQYLRNCFSSIDCLSNNNACRIVVKLRSTCSAIAILRPELD